MKPYYSDDLVTIYHGRAEDVLPSIADQSVDLVFTDPPYGREFDCVWDILAMESGRLLRPGKSLLTYVGHYQIPRVLSAFDGHLRYNWLCIQRNHGPKPAMFGARALASFKPILWFTKGPIERATGSMMQDDLTYALGKQRDVKHFHAWGQPVSLLPIMRLTDPSGFVLDPFMGSGTILVAAKDTGRRAVGIEMDEAYCEVAAQRCSQEVFGLAG